MEYILAILVLVAWFAAPNAALAFVTFGKAGEDSHLAFSALCVIPWWLFGLSLI